MSPITFLIIGVSTLLLLYWVWQVINGQKAANHRRKRLRRSDRVKLTPQQKKVYQEAERLYKEGKYKNSAKLIEALGMTREAITILEKGNHIHEAANILLRIHRPNRAGTIYARHGYWKDAAECFKKANMPNEVGKCSRESGDIATAIAYFIEAKNLGEAAECYVELGKHREAASLYVEVGKFDEAMEQYHIMIDKDPHFSLVSLKKDEIEMIIDSLSKGVGDIRLADIQIIKDYLAGIIVQLIKKSKFPMAQKIYQRTSADIGPQLIASEDLTPKETEMVGQLFFSGGAFEYAGMVYERLEMFLEAGESFEKAEDYDRAAYCFERAKAHQKVTDMRIKLASVGPLAKPLSDKNNKKPPSEKTNPFFMGEMTKNEKGASSDTVMMNAAVLHSQLEKTDPQINTFDHIPSPEKAHLNLGQDDRAIPKKESLLKESKKSIFKSGDTLIHPLQEVFNRADFLLDLSSEQKNLFQKVGRCRSYPPGSLILGYDQEPEGIYFILSGVVQASKKQAEQEIQLEDIHPPDTFGELWLLIEQRSRVRFTALTHVEILTISRPDFTEVLDKNGTVARKIYKRFIQKLISKLVTDENYGANLTAS